MLPLKKKFREFAEPVFVVENLLKRLLNICLLLLTNLLIFLVLKSPEDVFLNAFKTKKKQFGLFIWIMDLDYGIQNRIHSSKGSVLKNETPEVVFGNYSVYNENHF